MKRIFLTAPAKLNLYLEILGRRADGFHALESVFQTIELHDAVEVEISSGSGIALSCDDPSLPAGSDNLAWRAALAFIGERSAEAGRIDIRLAKAIPHGAGLGGGSSDAAAVLRGLDRLLPGWHAPHALAGIAAQLGSDVPFFLVGGTALAHGRGEAVECLPELPRLPVTVFMPAATLSTPAVYRELTEAERGPRTALGREHWLTRVATQPPATWLHNRLTAPATRLCPEVAELLAWLARQSAPYLMSGSGAACFALAHLPPPRGVRAWHTWSLARTASPPG